MFEMMSFRTDACPKLLCFRLNTSLSTALMLVAVHGLPLPDFLVIDPVCFKPLTKLFNMLLFYLLAGNSFVSLTAPWHLAQYKFLIKILSSTLKLIVLLSVYIRVVVFFVVMAMAMAASGGTLLSK